MSRPPRSHREYRDDDGDREHRRPQNGRSSPDRSSSRPPYQPREVDPPPKHMRDPPRAEHQESKCTHICSRRGIVLICAVLTDALVLICVVAGHMVSSGLSAAAAVGGFDLNSNFNLQGSELQQVRELDMQYSQMRAPSVYGGVPFSLVVGVVSLLFVIAANKPAHLLSRGLLYGALAFQAAGAAAYVAAVGLYLHFIIGINATDVCLRRERIYARNGYTWMSCDVSGADAAVALFGLITAVLFAVGAALTAQTVRGVRRYRRRREAERRQRGPANRAPPRADTTAV